MPKKTTILIVILALITGILIFLAIRSDQNQAPPTASSLPPTPTPVQPYTTLAFNPALVDASGAAGIQSTDIILDTQGKPASGVQIELTYDPAVVTNVTVTAPKTSLFGKNPNVLFQTINQSQGRITYAVGLGPTENEISGIGAVATLHFTVIKASGLTQSKITFLPKSAVTTLSSTTSVLSSTTPLTILLTAVTAVPLGQ